MKKGAVAIVLLALCILLFGCRREQPELTEGIYVASVDSDISISFEMAEENRFYYNYVLNKVITVPDITGTFAVEDGKVSCTAEEYTLIFEIVDKNTIRFVENGSTQPPSLVTDGMEFRLRESE